jgi:hypothetical protein
MNQQAVKHFVQRSIKAIMLLAVIAIGLSSCKENGEIVPVVQPTFLNFINADTAALNIYQNGTRINNISAISPGSRSGYLPIPSGAKIYQFKKAGAADYLINNYPLTLDYSTNYTLYAAGETADKLFVLKDVFLAGVQNMAEIRFINASPATTNFDVYIGNLSFKNQSFKSATSFNNIAVGATVITIYPSGSTTPVFSKSFTLVVGATYNLFIKGIPGNVQNPFSATLLIN